MSGALRQFVTCYANLQEAILNSLDENGVEYDFFLSTWKNEYGYEKVSFEDEETFEYALNLYKPKKYNYEIYDIEKSRKLAKESGLAKHQKKYKNQKTSGSYKEAVTGGKYANNQIGQLYNIYKANEIKKEYEQENNFVYDYVMRYRFDNVVTNHPQGAKAPKLQIAFFDFLKTIEKNHLYFAKNRWYFPRMNHREGYNDVDHSEEIKKLQVKPCPDDKFVIGHSKEMDILSSVYLNLPEMMEIGMEKYGVFPSIHYSWYVTCKKNKFQLCKCPYTINIYYKCPNLFEGNIERDKLWKEANKKSLTHLRKINNKKKKKGKK